MGKGGNKKQQKTPKHKEVIPKVGVRIKWGRYALSDPGSHHNQAYTVYDRNEYITCRERTTHTHSRSVKSIGLDV